MRRLTFSSRIAAAAQENRLAQAAAARRARGLPLLNLAESNPGRCGLGPSGVIEALAQPDNLRYAPDPRGLPVAREALAARLGCRRDELFLAASTSEAYAWLFKLLCDPGQAVLVPKPGYPLFDYLAGLEGLNASPYRLEYRHPAGWAVDIDALMTAAVEGDARAVVVINPNNPTGSYLGEAERRALLAFCAARGIALISDEVFLPYAVEGTGTSLGGEGACLCFTLDGLSKLLCLPQLKLGWIRISGPEPFAREAASRLEVIADTYLSAGAPAMNALPALLPQADAFVSSLRERLRGNLAAMRAAFEGAGSPYRVLRCEGGWTALLECPRVRTDEELALGLLEAEGIALHPGYLYDFEREGYLALSLILPPDEFKRGLEGLKRYLDGLLA